MRNLSKSPRLTDPRTDVGFPAHAHAATMTVASQSLGRDQRATAVGIMPQTTEHRGADTADDWRARSPQKDALAVDITESGRSPAMGSLSPLLSGRWSQKWLVRVANAGSADSA